MSATDRPEHPDAREHLAQLFHAHPDPHVVLDPQGRFVDVNAAFERLTGTDATELLGSHYADYVGRADANRVDEEFRLALEGRTREFDARGVDGDGEPIIVRVTNLPITVDGEVVRVVAITRDISEREAAREALEASEGRFRGLFEGAGAGIVIADLDGRVVDANQAYQEMVGYSLEELREIGLASLAHPDERAGDLRNIEALLAGETSWLVTERRFVRRDGRTGWGRASLSLIRDTDGQPRHLAATVEDTTEAKQAQERLRRSESLRRLAGDLALVGGWAVEADHTVYWSEEIFRILDAPEGEEPPLDEAVALYPPEHRERLEAAIEACLTEGTPFDLELEIDTYAGRRIPVRSIAEPQRDEHGRILRAIGAFQDISDLRTATREAQQAARRLTTTLESMTDAFFTLDRDWRFTFLNQRASELLQRDRDELLGRHVWEEFPEAVGTEVHEAYERAMAGGGTEVVEEYHYPPLDSWFTINAYPSEQGLAVYFRDVTAERAAHLAMEEREALLRRQAELLDQAQDAILVQDADHRITYWNRSAERIYGWSAQEAIGADVRELLHEHPGAFDEATAAVFEHGAWNGELAQRGRDGAEVVIAGRWTLVRDEAGEPDAVLAINTDVTEHKRVEQHLLRAQRMESIGTLAGGVAHDLNNVLSPILLAAELLQHHATDDQAATLLDTIQTSARRGADLVTQVLSFARGVEGQRAPIDVPDLLADIRAIVRDTFPKDIRLEIRAPEGLEPILGDRTQIQQVLLNLAVNARDAMPEGGELTIAASTVILDEQYAAATPGTTPGRYLLIEVEDSGHGMAPEVRERVFEPFFTTKPQGSGTGLGLSTSAAIVRSHEGFLRVYSEPGRGTRFRLYLPLDTQDAATTPDEPPSRDLPRGRGQTVLVVDDEAAVRAMTRQTLEAYGYRAMEASNGAEAVSTFEQHGDDIDVVITDMMMPVMDGPATIHALRRLAPGVRIIGASGLNGNGKVGQAADAGVEHFLPKPYTSRGLLELLAEVLSDE